MRVIGSRVALALLLLVCASAALAQAARTARLFVTVLDQTNAVLPGASVTVTPQQPAGADPSIVQTSERGVAQLTDLPLGRYTIRAEFPGFDAGVMSNVQLRAGDNRQTIVLRIANVEDQITVGQGAEEAASDRRGSSFGSARRCRPGR
jgi:hypothetical protein